MRQKLNINNGDIRYCETNHEEYLILGRTPRQSRAFRVLWRSGLRSHDLIEDIVKDKVVGHISDFAASNKTMLKNFVNSKTR